MEPPVREVLGYVTRGDILIGDEIAPEPKVVQDAYLKTLILIQRR